MGCSFSLNKDADNSGKKTEKTVTEEMEKTDADTEAVGSDTETSEEASSTAEADGKAAALPGRKRSGIWNRRNAGSIFR